MHRDDPGFAEVPVVGAVDADTSPGADERLAIMTSSASGEARIGVGIGEAQYGCESSRARGRVGEDRTDT